MKETGQQTCAKDANYSILGWIIEGSYMMTTHRMSKRILNLIMKKKILLSSKNYETNGYRHDLGLNLLSLSACFLFY